jgi:hypothetical protein
MTPERGTRRQMVRSLALGSVLLPGILQQALADDAPAMIPGGDTLDPRRPQFAPRAKRVIFLYMTGGVSHMDSFDPKPRLWADAGKNTDAKNPKSAKYLAPLWKSQTARNGAEVTDLFPHMRDCMEDICLIRSMHGDHPDHFQATLGVHTGSVTFARPSIGSWVSYGLGSENRNLPSFVVLAPELPYAGTQVFSSDFLPGCHNGTRILPGADAVPNLARRAPSDRIQSLELGLLARFNRKHSIARGADPALEARIRNFETAAGMQRAMPDVLDLSRETDATHRLYGLERGATQGFAWQCLVARRLVERGVRFVELIDVGSHDNWDAHGDMKSHGPLARNVDQPIAGLLKDLKSRGLLEDTLVVWTTEFGRSPWTDGPYGRGHFHGAYSSWLAGAGVKPGLVYGRTDDIGRSIVENPVHVHDFHATILHLLGFDHERLTFRHGGRDFRLTDVSGRVVTDLLA